MNKPTRLALSTLGALLAVLATVSPVRAVPLEVPVSEVFSSLLTTRVQLDQGSRAYARFLDRDGLPLVGLPVALARGRRVISSAETDARGDLALALSPAQLRGAFSLRFEVPAERVPVRVRATLSAPGDSASSSGLVDPNALPLLISADRRLGVYYLGESRRAGAARTLDKLAAADRVLAEAFGLQLVSGAVVLRESAGATTGGPGTPFDSLVVQRTGEGGCLGWGELGNVLHLRARTTLKRSLASADALPAFFGEGLPDLLAVRGLAGVDAAAAAARLDARALLLEQSGRSSWDLLAQPAPGACLEADPEAPARIGAGLAAWLELVESDDQIAAFLGRASGGASGGGPGGPDVEPLRNAAAALGTGTRALRSRLSSWSAGEAVETLRRHAQILRADAASDETRG